MFFNFLESEMSFKIQMLSSVYDKPDEGGRKWGEQLKIKYIINQTSDDVIFFASLFDKQ